jgi:hypothetical protein
MATIVGEAPAAIETRQQATERLFFWSMTVLIALIVFVGFSRTYFLAGLCHAKPLAAPIVHVHAAVFTSWFVLLVIQASLVVSGRTDLHRWLGIAGLVLAPLMVVLGIVVADEVLHRLAKVPGVDAKVIFAAALGQIVGFSLPVFFAFRLRRLPDFHKRLILIGSMALLGAAWGRWPIHFLLHNPLTSALAMFATLMTIVAYDLITLRKVHRATALGVAWVVCVQSAAVAIGPTAAWHNLAAHVPPLI